MGRTDTFLNEATRRGIQFTAERLDHFKRRGVGPVVMWLSAAAAAAAMTLIRTFRQTTQPVSSPQVLKELFFLKVETTVVFSPFPPTATSPAPPSDLPTLVSIFPCWTRGSVDTSLKAPPLKRRCSGQDVDPVLMSYKAVRREADEDHVKNEPTKAALCCCPCA